MATESTSISGDERKPPPDAEPGRRNRRKIRTRRGAQSKILIRIDYDTFLEGVVGPGETCELVGFGPVPVSAVRDFMATGDPFIGAILTKGKRLVGVAHLGRSPT